MSAELCENRTKYGLDGALRQLLERKPLDQIRVRELTELCAIRRQSFYYHFPDVYALFHWSLQQERVRVVARQTDFLTWQQALRDLLEYTAENRSYYRAILENRGRSYLREVLDAPLSQLLETTQGYYQSRCGAARVAETEKLQRECCETILLTMIESWVQQELKQSPEDMITLLEAAIRQGAMGAAWQNLPQWNNC